MIEIKGKKFETLDSFYSRLVDGANRSGQVCFGNFNGKFIFSTESIDQAYKKVTGRNLEEFNVYLKLIDEYIHDPSCCDYLSKAFNGSDEEWSKAKERLLTYKNTQSDNVK